MWYPYIEVFIHNAFRKAIRQLATLVMEEKNGKLKTKIALLCPIAQLVEPLVFKHTLAMVSNASHHGIEISNVGTTDRMLIHQARNVLAKEFLDTECQWAFWMDSDQIFPADTISVLLRTAQELGAEFVTGVYYQRLGQHNPVLWLKDPVTTEGKHIYEAAKERKDYNETYTHHYVAPGLNAKKPFRADVCGFGCVLVHRNVLENMKPPYFEMISDECSEDFYFCNKAKKSGAKLWAVPSIRVGHVGKPMIVFKEHYHEAVKDKEKTSIEVHRNEDNKDLKREALDGIVT